jgi:hypothetical protein
MPQDERAQIEAFVGEPWDLDRASVGNFVAPGPKWVIKHAETEEDFAVGRATPIVVGGFVPQRPGVWRDFLLTTPQAWSDHWFACTRICRRVMDAMFVSGQAHRLECIVPVPRVESRPELCRWYKVLGYNEEGLHHGYCANGADAYCFARVQH